MVTVTHLPRISSDHSPLLIKIKKDDIKPGNDFIFQCMWTDHPDFLSTVRESWKLPVNGSPALVLQNKLSRIKKVLTAWNWNSFGNVHSRQRQAQDHLQELESRLQQGWDELIHCEWTKERKELLHIEAWENELLCNKARLDWTKEGARNTKFFHAVTRERRKKQLIQITRNDGDVTTSAKEIGELAVNFFSELFTASPYRLEASFFDNIHTGISDLDDQFFCGVPTVEEVWEAIKQMNPSISPGTDGFTGYFY